MDDLLFIKPLVDDDIDFITEISRKEGFAPGVGDLAIYQNTDKQGLWVGWLDGNPIGCIAGVRYNQNYGFLGLFLVIEKFRGRISDKKFKKNDFRYSYHLVDFIFSCCNSKK